MDYRYPNIRDNGNIVRINDGPAAVTGDESRIMSLFH